jgi:hypothetical protein
MRNGSLKGELTNQNDALLVSEFCSIMGSLQYFATGCRPDICYATNALSRFSKKTEPFHLKAAYRVLRYLKGSVSASISIKINNMTSKNLLWNFDAYTDADLGGPEISNAENMLTPTSCKSPFGFVVLLDNTPIFFKSRNKILQRNRQQNRN